MTQVTVDLGKIKFNWRGAYDPAVTYYKDDVVSYGGSSHVLKVTSSTAVAPVYVNGVHAAWDLMAQGGDPSSIMTTQGDLLVRGSSGLERLPLGTADQTLGVSSGGMPEWQGTSAWRMVSHSQTTYSGGNQAASTSRGWINGMFADFTPQYSNSKIFIHAQFTHADSGTGAITLAHIYRDTNLILSTNLSGHNFYVSQWNSMSYWFDSWGTTSSRVGIKGSKYSSSYNIYWHSSGYTGLDESPANGAPHSIARNGLFTIQEWLPA